jgi:tetratricopeptide (TPR) repeat protein
MAFVIFQQMLSSAPTRSEGARTRLIWGILIICGLTLLAYWPALHGGFVWDDDHFLTENPLIRASDGLRRFWCTTEAPDYWPVTSTSLWLEWRCWGMNAAGYHATNLLLHVSSALLLWSVLRRLRLPGAFLAALLFALHPVNVESVAWITQRKNLLAMVFFLMSIGAFVRSDPALLTSSRSHDRREDRGWHALSLLAFVLGMLSKGSIAMLPGVLLGIVAWQRRLVAKDWLRLLPFGLVAAILTGVNVWFQHHRSAEAIRAAGSVQRLLEAGAIAWFYLGKAIWPLHLSFCYPQWSLPPDLVTSWLPVTAALLGFTALGIVRGRTGRSLRAGLGYFALMLVPVLGLTDVYFMRYSLVADHYEHLAMLGVIGVVAAGWEKWRMDSKGPGPTLAAGVTVAVLTVLTWQQCGIYRDRLTLFQATLKENPRSWMAYNNLGTLRQERGETGEAIADYRQALRIDSGLAEVHFNLANSLADAGRGAEALPEYRAAIRLQPKFPEAYYCEGLVLARAGNPGEASADFERALQIRAHFPEAEVSLANALAAAGRPSEAVGHYRAALKLRPNLPAAHNDWGNFLLGQGRLPEAIGQFQVALRLRATYAQAHYNLGVAWARSQRLADATAEYERALALQPNYPEAENNLGAALAVMGRGPEAIQHYQRALRLKPDYPEARANLELARQTARP